MLTGNNPSQSRLPDFLRTRETVGLLTERRFGIHLSRWTVRRYLNDWDMTDEDSRQ